MIAEPFHEEMTPQQWRVWCALRNGEERTIEDLFCQARPMAYPDLFTRREKQQIVGAVLVRINDVLKLNDCLLRAQPGVARGTYRLR